jgi:hypothetical protein
MSKFDKLTEAYLKVVNEDEQSFDHTDNSTINPPKLNTGWKATPIDSKQTEGKVITKYELLKDFKDDYVSRKKGDLVDSNIIVIGHGMETEIPKEFLKERHFIKVTAVVTFEVTKA